MKRTKVAGDGSCMVGSLELREAPPCPRSTKGGNALGKLYDTKVAIQKVIEQRGLDSAKVSGSICLKAGLLMALIKPETPDDPAKLEKLKTAAKDVLGVSL